MRFGLDINMFDTGIGLIIMIPLAMTFYWKVHQNDQMNIDQICILNLQITYKSIVITFAT